MPTEYFTFGQDHHHDINGLIFDKDTVIRITHDDPRAVMFTVFGRKWAMQYSTVPDMRHFPGGIVELDLSCMVQPQSSDQMVALGINDHGVTALEFIAMQKTLTPEQLGDTLKARGIHPGFAKDFLASFRDWTETEKAKRN